MGSNPPDISGDPQQPNQKQLAADRATAEQMMRGTYKPPPAQAPSDAHATAQKGNQPQQQAEPSALEASRKLLGDIPGTVPGAGVLGQMIGSHNSQAQPTSLQSMLSGTFNDSWDYVRAWGRVFNASIADAGAVQASVQNIEHDQSVGGQLKAHLLHIQSDPQGFDKTFQEEWLPELLTLGANWEPWAFVPEMAANMPQHVSSPADALAGMPGIGAGVAGQVKSDFSAKGFEAGAAHPQYWERMATYLLAATALLRGGRKAIPVVELLLKIPGMDHIAAVADRAANGPEHGVPTEIRGPNRDGMTPSVEDYKRTSQMSDPIDPILEHEYELAPKPKPMGAQTADMLPNGEIIMKSTDAKLQSGLRKAAKILGLPDRPPPTKLPGGGFVSAADRAKLDAATTKYQDALDALEEAEPGAARDEAQRLSDEAKAELQAVAKAAKFAPQAAVEAIRKDWTQKELRDHFLDMASKEQVSTTASKWIAGNWAKFGAWMGIYEPLMMHVAGEAPHIDPLWSLEQLQGDSLERGTNLLSAHNGLETNIRHGTDGWASRDALTSTFAKGVMSLAKSRQLYARDYIKHMKKLLAGTKADAVTAAHEDPALYGALSTEQKLARDSFRRVLAGIYQEGRRRNLYGEGQPNYLPRVRVRNESLETAYARLDPDVRRIVAEFGEHVRGAGGAPLGKRAMTKRAIRLKTDEEGGVFAESAHRTVAESNEAIDQQRLFLKNRLRDRAKQNSKLQAIVNDPARLDALLHRELPKFETDYSKIVEQTLERHLRDLDTRKWTQDAMHMLVTDPKQVVPHHLPGGILIDRQGLARNPYLDEHLKRDLGPNYTRDFLTQQLGYRRITGAGDDYLFHPTIAEPLNRYEEFQRMHLSAPEKAIKFGQHLIMWDIMWHGMNEMGAGGQMLFAHPVDVFRASAKGLAAHNSSLGRFAAKLQGMTPEDARAAWEAEAYERITSGGGVPPRLHGDGQRTLANQLTEATQDMEFGGSMAGEGVEPLSTASRAPQMASMVGALKGIDNWYAQHVTDHLWAGINQLANVSYVVEKHAALDMGVPEREAKLIAGSRSNAFAGVVSPDRWMYNPQIYRISQALFFAPNFWRSFPRTVIGSYDRMGIKGSPEIKALWATNAVKYTAAMLMFDQVYKNSLNWLLSGHWMYQNPDGYQQSITADRFVPEDPQTGSHMVVEPFLDRRFSDLMKVLGIQEVMQGQGEGTPEHIGARAANVLLGRASAGVNLAEVAANLNLYQTIKNGGLMWNDPAHPGLAASPESWAAAVMQLSPLAFPAQDFVQALSGQYGTADKQVDLPGYGSVKVPYWASSLWDVKHPILPLIQLLGVRTPTMQVRRTDDAGLGSAQMQEVQKLNTTYDDGIQTLDQEVASGQISLKEWTTHYFALSDQRRYGLTSVVGTGGQYMEGAAGIEAQYFALYADPSVTDAAGDINYQRLQQLRDQLQSKTDPATWQLFQDRLKQQEMRHPAVAVYEQTLTAYRDFQDLFAGGGVPGFTKLGENVDGAQLRDMISQYAQMPRSEQTAYERQHPIIQQFYAARKKWEFSSSAGLMYGLYHDSSFVTRDLMRLHPGETLEQAEGQELQEAETGGLSSVSPLSSSAPPGAGGSSNGADPRAAMGL